MKCLQHMKLAPEYYCQHSGTRMMRAIIIKNDYHMIKPEKKVTIENIRDLVDTELIFYVK